MQWDGRERESRSFCSKHDRLCQLLSLPLAFAFEKERTFTDEEEEKEALKMSIKRCFRLWPAAHSWKRRIPFQAKWGRLNEQASKHRMKDRWDKRKRHLLYRLLHTHHSQLANSKLSLLRRKRDFYEGTRTHKERKGDMEQGSMAIGTIDTHTVLSV